MAGGDNTEPKQRAWYNKGMKRVPVDTAHASYEVVIERGGVEQAASYFEAVVGGRRLFVVADREAWRHQGPRLERGLRGRDYTLLELDPGEQNKRLAQIETLADRIYAAGADRTACVVAFGGGIAGDIGGFLAAVYMRGVDVIQVPTTLLAQVDASIGGKTGVNLAEGKNLVGSFHQPRLVLIDPEALATLPERQYRAGLYEVIKTGIVWSRDLFDLLDERRVDVLARDPGVLETIITQSAAIKAEVVGRDEREGDLRRILNYGHTLGHALESETEYRRLLHGEAVAYGMIAAGHLAEAIGMLAADDRERIERLILRYGPIPSLEGVEVERLLGRLGGDKKTIGGRVHFVLPTEIGTVKVVSDIDSSLIREAAEAGLLALATASAEAHVPVETTATKQ